MFPENLNVFGRAVAGKTPAIFTNYFGTLPNIEDLLKPLERASDELIPSMVDHKCTQLERDVLSLPVRLGGLGFTNPTQKANPELQASVNVTATLAERIMSQVHEPPDEAEVTLFQQKAKKEKEEKITKAIGRVEEFSTRKNGKSCQSCNRGGSVKLVNNNFQYGHRL